MLGRFQNGNGLCHQSSTVERADPVIYLSPLVCPMKYLNCPTKELLKVNFLRITNGIGLSQFQDRGQSDKVQPALLHAFQSVPGSLSTRTEHDKAMIEDSDGDTRD